MRKTFWQLVSREAGGLLAEEVRLERVHAGDREQRGGVTRRRNERRARDAQVTARLEEGEVLLADLI